MPTTTLSSSTPPVASYIFRHHNHPIHALHFFDHNALLASGDSSGLIVIWRLTTRRPAAIFQAHDAGIMGIKDWGGRRLITHGRDHKLRIWDIKATDLEGNLRGSVQISASGNHTVKDNDNGGRKPWLLHSMSVNALNFCAFSICDIPQDGSQAENASTTESGDIGEPKQACGSDSTNSSETTSIGRKTAKQASTNANSPPGPLLIAAPNGLDSGGIDIFHLPSEHRISQIRSAKDSTAGMVMALDLSYDTKGARFLLTAGYEDGSVAVYETSKGDEPSISWTWTRILTSRPHSQPVLSLDNTPDCTSLITSSADAIITRFVIPASTDAEFTVGSSEPERTRNTKHAGQQDLKIRSDGKIFATAGWDGNLRVYSAKTLKELAVLQWHKDGCYAVAFADVVEEVDSNKIRDGAKADPSLVQMNGMDRMKQERDREVRNTHWLVGGSKDGKISLWDIY